MHIEKSTFDFLKALRKNNNRNWFNDNRSRYESALENVTAWTDELIRQMNQHDRLHTGSGKEALYRIYKDVRFSKDRIPYNPRFAGHLKRVKPQFRGGYYFWIKPGESRVGCGFTYPNAADLFRIRQDIDAHHKEWRKILEYKRIVKTFGNMQGALVKTVPRGFDKDHPAIDLLRCKQFWFERTFSDREVLSTDFLNKVNSSYRNIRPFFDYMSEVLTTDLNGESSIK